MVSPPRMPKLNSEAVVRHYHALAEAVDIDLVVQDYPPISGYAMEPWLLARVAKEIPRARTIKLEDPPTPFKTSRILEQTAGLDVRIFGGLGGVFLLEELMAGATGAMTLRMPGDLVRIVELFQAARSTKRPKSSSISCPLMRFEFQEGLATRRSGRKGCIAAAWLTPRGDRLRPPRSTSTTRQALDRVLKWTETI
jgi:4-hydroxy-tetrahydrodipicolinate synthase